MLDTGFWIKPKEYELVFSITDERSPMTEKLILDPGFSPS
jgi:hypothetical protein